MRRFVGAVLVVTVLVAAGCGLPSQSATSRPGSSQTTATPAEVQHSGASHQIGSNNSATEQLSFKLRDELLRGMSNPAQGQDCVGATCSIHATVFSGPATRGKPTILNMAYARYGQWYVIVAPTPQSALARLQSALARAQPLPHSAGVMVVHTSIIDYYWLANGQEHRATKPFTNS